MSNDVMTATGPSDVDRSSRATEAAGQFSWRRSLSASDLFAAAAVALYASSVHIIPTSRIGQYGLIPALPVPVLLAVGLLVVASAMALAARTLVVPRVASYLAALTFFLYGTAALVYREPRYSWLYQYVGVVQYINAHGALDRHIDIYQNWPGFFTLAAWFDRVAGIQNPLSYAKWAQFAFELLTVTIVAFVLKALPLTQRERWTALFFYIAANWVGQDYFSEQALGVVLALGVIGIALHALVRTGRPNAVGRFAIRLVVRTLGVHRRRRPRGVTPAAGTEAGTADPTGDMRLAIGALLVLVFVYFVLVFVHELSPYLVLAELGALALVGWLRPSWTIAVLAAIAVGYLAPRFSFVNQRYGLLASIGKFFSNVRPPAAGNVAPIVAGIHLSYLASELLSFGMWVLAAAGAWIRWRNGRSTLVLVLLTVAPVLVVAGQAYGNTAILRAYLFSLPWVAALCASAVWALGSHVNWVRALQFSGVLAVTVTLFGASFYGGDQVVTMPVSEVKAMQDFYRVATPGPVYRVNTNFPGLLAPNYQDFPQYTLIGQYGVMELRAIRPGSGRVVAGALTRAGATRGHPAYIVLAATEKLWGVDQGLIRRTTFTDLRSSLLSDPEWTTVIRGHGILVEELPPST